MRTGGEVVVDCFDQWFQQKKLFIKVLCHKARGCIIAIYAADVPKNVRW